MLAAELGDNLIPVSRVPQDSGGDPAAARAGEDAGRGVMADRVEAAFDERADFFDERDGSGSLSFGAFVDEATGARRCLPPDRPGPGIAVNVKAQDAGYFANAGGGAGGEDDDVAPALKVIGRPGDERRGQVAESLPVGQRPRSCSDAHWPSVRHWRACRGFSSRDGSDRVARYAECWVLPPWTRCCAQAATWTSVACLLGAHPWPTPGQQRKVLGRTGRRRILRAVRPRRAWQLTDWVSEASSRQVADAAAGNSRKAWNPVIR